MGDIWKKNPKILLYDTLVLRSLEDHKSPGPDSIPNEFLKRGGPTLYQALTILYTRCVQAQCTPEDWGEAETIMLYKKGDATLLDNYRGISLSNTIGKVFCSILNNRLVSTLEFNNVFGRLQFGFRHDFRTSDALYILGQVLASRKDAGQETFAAFLDLKKAYDVVDRKRLWERLLELGLPNQLVSFRFTPNA